MIIYDFYFLILFSFSKFIVYYRKEPKDCFDLPSSLKMTLKILLSPVVFLYAA